MDNFYPYIRYPFAIESIIKENFHYPPIAYEPTPPKLETVEQNGIYILLLSFVIFFVSISAEIAPLVIIAMSGIFFSIFKINNERQKTKNLKEAFSNNLQYYNNQVRKYNESVRVYNQFATNLKNYKWKNDYKISLLKSEFKDSAEPNIKAKGTKGVTEKFFLNKLLQHFDKKQIKTNLTVEQYTENLYIPDIIIHDTNNNIYIDIEIDEPYILKTGEPIHYLEVIESASQHTNYYRDDFFINKNWIVLRFAEEQIVRYPIKCCNLIGKVLYDLSLRDDYKSMYYSYEDDPLEEIEVWRFEDAAAMSDLKHRENYLKNKDGFYYFEALDGLVKEVQIDDNDTEETNLDYSKNDYDDLPF